MSDEASTSHSPTKKMRRVAGDRPFNRRGYDDTTQKILEDIDRCQSEVDSLTERASTEILVVEQKYNLMKKPLYARRTELISNIPNFWFTTITNHPDLRELIQEAEEDCMQHLNNLEVEINDDVRTGYAIRFYFDENPYFENEVLIKTYRLGDSSASESSTIVWKEGYDLTQAPSNYRPGVKRRFEQRSFFTWFTDDVESTTDDIAELIKDDLWTNPLQYYLVHDEEENGVDGSSDSESSDGDEGEDADRKRSISSVDSIDTA